MKHHHTINLPYNYPIIDGVGKILACIIEAKDTAIGCCVGEVPLDGAGVDVDMEEGCLGGVTHHGEEVGSKVLEPSGSVRTIDGDTAMGDTVVIDLYFWCAVLGNDLSVVAQVLHSDQLRTIAPLEVGQIVLIDVGTESDVGLHQDPVAGEGVIWGGVSY